MRPIAKGKGAPRPSASDKPSSALASRAKRTAMALARLYPEAHITLDFATPWQCLVATILSAQCTDERVNRVTPSLFGEIPDVLAMARAPLKRIQELIAPTGFFRAKSRALKGSAERIVGLFGGAVPDRMEDLLTLPGVGRKTANVILGHVYGKPAVTVDTHVRRLARRLGLSRATEPDRIERDLQRLLPPAQWTVFSMRLILHGRKVCHARRPRCASCPLLPDCPQLGVPAEIRGASRAKL